MQSTLYPKTPIVATKIRERRIYLNYTQEYVAGKLKISQNAYSKIECGHISISVDRIYEIASILETEIQIFLI